MSSTFLLHHSYNKLEFSDQGCHCLLEQNQPMLWETKGKEHPLFKGCCSSKREAQSSAFPCYFLSELPLRTLPALLPLCVSQTSTDLAEPTLAVGSSCSAQTGCRAPAQISDAASELWERPSTGRDCDFQGCQVWNKHSPEQAHWEFTPPSGSVLGWRRVNNTHPPELDL